MRQPGYWQVAGIYTSAFGMIALVFPYMNQYLLALGFTGVQIGNLYAAASLAGIVLTPMISSAADRSGRHRRLYWLVLAVEIAMLAGIGLTRQVLLVGAAVLVMRSVMRLDTTMRERLSLHWLRLYGSEAFGSLRLWGSIGFAGMAMIGGPAGEQIDPQWLFLAGGGLLVLVALFSRVYDPRLPVQPRLPLQPRMSLQDRPAARPVGSIWRQAGALSPVLWMIMITAFLVAVGQSMYFGWNYAFIENTLDGGKSTVGLFAGLAAGVEVPFMLLTDRWMRRWGAVPLWGIGLLIWGVSWFLLAKVQTPQQALVFSVTAGIAQGFAIVAPVVFVGQVSQPHNTALNLALMGVLAGLGTMIGSATAGWLFDVAGVRVVLQVAAGMVVVATVFLWVSMAVVRRRAITPHPTG